MANASAMAWRKIQTKKNIRRPPSLIIHRAHRSRRVRGLYGVTFMGPPMEVLDLCKPWSRLRSVLLRCRWPGWLFPKAILFMSGCCSSAGTLPSEKSRPEERFVVE